MENARRVVVESIGMATQPAVLQPTPKHITIDNAKELSRKAIESKRNKRAAAADVIGLARKVVVDALLKGDARVAVAVLNQTSGLASERKIEQDDNLTNALTLLSGTNPSSREAHPPHENVTYSHGNFSESRPHKNFSQAPSAEPRDIAAVAVENGKLRVLESRMNSLESKLDRILEKLEAK